ncbi:MAG: argininosuccinate synthase [Acidilobaceae archaeon]|nr:argininosuccinate synthase [Acidilobaceae archaeon]MCX8165943.1 argininosuccinate synthase [Acidilobaceae archaeon]MDW7974586.1 argininosuccinate synthase [Sulfolobales archaeon]
MRVVLAYSGGLDTSVILKLLQEKLGAEVVTVTVDVGQEDDLAEVEQKAYRLGAKAHYTVEAKEEFVRDYVFKAVMMNALYDGAYPLSTALARPLIAEKVAEVAKKEGADAVAHGCTGKGNDQLRFDIAFKALLPGIKIIAPVREWGLTREWEAQYAAKHGIPVKSKAYSIDENLWGRSVEGGAIEDITAEPPEEIYAWTVNPAKAPDEPLYLEVEFSAGVPSRVNGEKMGPVEMVKFLNQVAGAHGVGRVDMIENRVVGLKSREIYEVPAATVLITAHKELERLTLTKRSMDFKEMVDGEWAKLVYQGLWFEPLREALEAFAYKLESRVTGNVRLKLFKGSVSVVGRNSPYGLYDFDLISYFRSGFDQKMAIGFVELFGFQAVASHHKRPS